MDTPNDTIRATLRALLAYRQISGADFADQVGMKRATWYSRMAGTSDWTAAEVQRAASALDVPVADLYRGMAA
jgi:hypothetical protein